MKNSDFGGMIASLRKELKNEFDEPLSQMELAALTNIPLVTIQKIEQGRLKNITIEHLVKLANALQVPPHARVFFFLGSFNLEKYVDANMPEVNSVLSLLTQQSAALPYPSNVTNCFGDLLFSDSLFLRIANVNPAITGAENANQRLNFYRFLYSPEYKSIQDRLGESYSKFAERSILKFKAETLAYRSHWYYKKLLPELNHYPLFRKYWQGSLFQYSSEPILMSTFSINHPKWGKLEFLSSPIRIPTDTILLVLTHYHPLNTETALACIRMIEESGNEIIHLSDGVLPTQGS